MIWLLATRRITTKLLNSPFTETDVAGAHSLVYMPGVEPIREDGQGVGAGALGTFSRGLHRVSGMVFSFDGDVGEKLLGISVPISLKAYYLANSNEHRVRTFIDVVFVGDATVRVPTLSSGSGDLIGVPFKVNIPEGDELSDHVTDAAE